MPAPSTDAAPVMPPTEIHTNGESAAQTVRDTVMAEQVSHNVVNDSVSASASAPADVAANQTTTPSAAPGTHTPTPTQLPDTTDTSATTAANIEATDANSSLGKPAEPSAGDAAPPKAHDEPSKLPNGFHDVIESDGSVGVSSDAEGQRKDAQHVRTNSVKKPTTFSKVSVTKNFMAKTASPVPAAAKIGEKPSPLSSVAQPVNTAKPRLVAKTGALQSIQKARAGSESASGPDASKVWNKNRRMCPNPCDAVDLTDTSLAAAPQPPKTFTDEELKQQYGIHLATRLQTDESGKESKWADIDDDEEDWAPEAVVWMDGTKSTLTPADAAPQQKEQKSDEETPSEKPTEAVKPTLIKRPTESGPQRTILKPGIMAQQAKQQNGSAGTPTSEKPSLKAKSPAPAPAKSPWAQLPPVEAISPIHPPVQQQQMHLQSHRLPTQDARAYDDPAALAQPPAREIAADTFDRSWREGEGAPRELFNSTSGRYEPAPEGRRSSVRPDPYGRKPSVLQRPMHGAPAEPSAAFQSRSSSQMDGSWGRRRGSSVSQGSASARRMSVTRPDMPPPSEERRRSTVVGHDMRQDGLRPQFAQQSAWDQQMPPRPEQDAEPAVAAEDPVKVQERVMREKREEAKRRRKEEEERVEKERQERLKAKLAALEGAGKSRKEREAEAAAQKEAHARPSLTETSAPAQKSGTQLERPAAPAKPAEASATVGPALEEQSLPTAPSQQPTDNLPLPLPKPIPTGLSEHSERPISSDEQRQPARAHLSPGAATRPPFGQQPYKATSAYSSPGDRKQQPYRSTLTSNDAFQGWGSSAPNGNVWSTPGLGNGIFDKNSSFAPIPMSQQTSLPPPPGMSRISPNGFGQDTSSPSLQNQQVTEQQRAFPPPGIDARAESGWGAPRTNGVSPAPGFERPNHPPGPIAPPSRAQQQPQPVQRPSAISAWNNAASRLPQEYAAEAAAAERKKQEETVPRELPTIKDTFRQTSAGQKLGAPRKYGQAEYTIHDGQGSRAVSTLSPAPPSTQTQPNGPVPTASPHNDAWRQPANTVKIPDGSENPAHGGLPDRLPPIGTPSQQQVRPATYRGQVHYPTGPLPTMPPLNTDTPPPPETTSHPVYGETYRPNVKLPTPSPRVRLPPGPTSPVQTPQMTGIYARPMMPQRPIQVWGSQGAARPIAMTEDWQARFNGLFDRVPTHTEVPPSPPKTPPKAQGPALAVVASSRAVVDEGLGAAATVSLPKSTRNKTRGPTDVSSDTTSKPTMEYIFNEELSFGSLPNVALPPVPAHRYEPIEPRINLLRMAPNSKFGKTVEAQSHADISEAHNLLTYFHKNPSGFHLKIPGTRLNNKLVRDRGQAGKGKRVNNGRVHNNNNKSNRSERTPRATPAQT
jgi:hypothetical protein